MVIAGKNPTENISAPSWPMHSIEVPHQTNDVLCGRGGGTNHHPGNKRWRKMIEDKKPDYAASIRSNKPKIAMNIVKQWRSQTPPGRFLILDKKTGLWSDIGDEKAKDKTSQAFREKTIGSTGTQQPQQASTGFTAEDDDDAKKPAAEFNPNGAAKKKDGSDTVMEVELQSGVVGGDLPVTRRRRRASTGTGTITETLVGTPSGNRRRRRGSTGTTGGRNQQPQRASTEFNAAITEAITVLASSTQKRKAEGKLIATPQDAAKVPRQQLLYHRHIENPQQTNDVLCGRGNNINDHPEARTQQRRRFSTGTVPGFTRQGTRTEQPRRFSTGAVTRTTEGSARHMEQTSTGGAIEANSAGKKWTAATSAKKKRSRTTNWQ